MLDHHHHHQLCMHHCKHCTCIALALQAHTGHLPALLFLCYSHDKIFFLLTTDDDDDDDWSNLLLLWLSSGKSSLSLPTLLLFKWHDLAKKWAFHSLFYIERASLWFFACRLFSFFFSVSLARVLIRIRGRVCLQLFPILSRSFFSFQELQKHKSLFLQLPLLLPSALIIHRVPGFTVSRSLWQI